MTQDHHIVQCFTNSWSLWRRPASFEPRPLHRRGPQWRSNAQLDAVSKPGRSSRSSPCFASWRLADPANHLGAVDHVSKVLEKIIKVYKVEMLITWSCATRNTGGNAVLLLCAKLSMRRYSPVTCSWLAWSRWYDAALVVLQLLQSLDWRLIHMTCWSRKLMNETLVWLQDPTS